MRLLDWLLHRAPAALPPAATLDAAERELVRQQLEAPERELVRQQDRRTEERTELVLGKARDIIEIRRLNGLGHPKSVRR